MTRPNDLLERLEQVNPVPDPSRLYEDTEAGRHFFLSDEQRRRKTMSSKEIDQLTPGPEGPRVRRGLAVGAAAAVLVVIVGVAAFAFLTDDGTDVAAGDSRILEATFDGERCTTIGAAELTAGTVEIAFHNESSQKTWFWFGSVDEGKTIEDLIEYNENGSGPPSWTTTVTTAPQVGANTSSTPALVSLEPGLHAFTCGTWTPYQAYTGGAVTVTP